MVFALYLLGCVAVVIAVGSVAGTLYHTYLDWRSSWTRWRSGK
jgi:hypothetical protein